MSRLYLRDWMSSRSAGAQVFHVFMVKRLKHYLAAKTPEYIAQRVYSTDSDAPLVYQASLGSHV